MCPLRNELEEDYYGLFDFPLDEDPVDKTESVESKEVPAEVVISEEPLSVSDRLGRSAKDQEFRFDSQILFQRNGALDRILTTLKYLLPALAVAALFLFLAPIPQAYVWLLVISLLILGILCFLLSHIFRKTWERNHVPVTLCFQPETLLLRLPESISPEFAPSTGSLENNVLEYELPLDSVLEQQYESSERSTLLTIDVAEGKRLLKIRIPDAALARSERNLLETEIFNRSGRSLRAV